VEQANESYIGLTSENSMKDSGQDSLPYILESHGSC